jgi:hypothetical protein
MNEIINIQNQELLYTQAISIIEGGRQNIIDSIYKETTKSYYFLGRLIVEDEQEGNEKAEYGKSIVQNLSKELTLKYGKGFSSSTLWDCQKFYKKLQSLTGELECSQTEQLNFQLSFTHYSYLIRLDNEEMKFYEKYAIEQKLSVRGLQKAVKSNMILRTSREKKSLTISTLKPKDIIKDPYVLDFLGLDEVKTGQEKMLENRLIEHLEKFLLELGRGFAFVGR